MDDYNKVNLEKPKGDNSDSKVNLEKPQNSSSDSKVSLEKPQNSSSDSKVSLEKPQSSSSDSKVNLEKPQGNNFNTNINTNPAPNPNPVPSPPPVNNQQPPVQQPFNNYNQNNAAPRFDSPSFTELPSDGGKTVLSIVSLVLGILSILMGCCCGIGILMGIGAVVTGGISKSKNMGGAGMAIAGIVTGSIGILFGIIGTLSFLPAFMEGFIEGMESLSVFFIK